MYLTSIECDRGVDVLFVGLLFCLCVHDSPAVDVLFVGLLFCLCVCMFLTSVECGCGVVVLLFRLLFCLRGWIAVFRRGVSIYWFLLQNYYSMYHTSIKKFLIF